MSGKLPVVPATGARSGSGSGSDGVRAQSHVVGVVLLLGLTTVALGGLTVMVGTIVQEQTGHADATRVAQDLDGAIRPVDSTGPRVATVSFSEGTLETRPRELRILDRNGTRRSVRTDALVFRNEHARVAAVGGAIVRGPESSSWLVRRPSVTSGPDVLIVSAPRLNATGSVGGTGGVSVSVRTNVSHERIPLGTDEFSVAIETRTPAAFKPYARSSNATFRTEDVDGDGIPSAILEYPGSREGFLVVHDLRLEVGHV